MSNRLGRFCLAVGFFPYACAHAADGDLDAAFGSSGKVQLGPITGGNSPVANDVAVRSDGKVVLVGYETFTSGGSPFEVWRLTRLNADGSPDATFAGSGTTYINGNATPTRAQAVALRADGRIVVGGSITSGGRTLAVVYQLLAAGTDDPSFNGGNAVVIAGTGPSDSIYISRLVIDSDGSIDIAGTYYANASGFNSNEFYFARISADGNTVEPFQYQFGTGANQDDHATDLSIDSQGRYVLAGYHRGASGNYDFAAIRIRHDLYDVDNTFGNAGQTTIDFGDSGDFCNAIAIFPSSGDIILGGHATANASSGTYQAAALAELDSNGNLNQYFSGGLLYPAKFVFSYSLNPVAGQVNDITKLMVDSYDTKYPQLLAVGTGNQYAQPPGEYFGIARLDPPHSYTNFDLDTSLNGKGVMGVYFTQRPTGLGNYITTNYGLSGAFANRKLVAAGYTEPSNATTEIAVTRLAAFDGIFKNGFETPSY